MGSAGSAMNRSRQELQTHNSSASSRMVQTAPASMEQAASSRGLEFASSSRRAGWPPCPTGRSGSSNIQSAGRRVPPYRQSAPPITAAMQATVSAPAASAMPQKTFSPRHRPQGTSLVRWVVTPRPSLPRQEAGNDTPHHQQEEYATASRKCNRVACADMEAHSEPGA